MQDVDSEESARRKAVVNNFVAGTRQRGTTAAKERTVSNPVQMRPSREGCKAALEGGPPELFSVARIQISIADSSSMASPAYEVVESPAQ